MFEGDCSTLAAWFSQWIAFMFDVDVTVTGRDGKASTKKVCDLLQPIKKVSTNYAIICGGFTAFESSCAHNIFCKYF